jgi:hypothetical protein
MKKSLGIVIVLLGLINGAIAQSWNLKGTPIDGDKFSMSDDGNTVAVVKYPLQMNYTISSAPKSTSLYSSGVKVYDFVNGDWVMRGSEINVLTESFMFPICLSGDGNTVLVSDQYNDDIAKMYSDNLSGKITAYKWDGANWVVKGQPIKGSSLDRIGSGICLSYDGNTLAFSAPDEQKWKIPLILKKQAEGFVSVYEWKNNDWKQKGNRGHIKR